MCTTVDNIRHIHVRTKNVLGVNNMRPFIHPFFLEFVHIHLISESFHGVNVSVDGTNAVIDNDGKAPAERDGQTYSGAHTIF
jgi:hypothetical protein